MKILWHNFEPGLSGKTADQAATGGAGWQSYLFRKFRERGWQVFWAGEGDVDNTESFRDAKFWMMDVAFFYWRWPMPDRPERQASYVRQRELIIAAFHHGVPVIVFDGDYKLSDDDRVWLTSHGAMIAAPTIRYKPGIMGLVYPDPYEGVVFPDDAIRRGIVYVGNNYERYDQTCRFFAGSSLLMPVQFWGNWVAPNPHDREDPERVRRDMPKVEFAGRCPNDMVLGLLHRARWTIHLAKPQYCEDGFMTIRWAEAAAVGTPAFVPREFYTGSEVLGKVSDQSEMSELYMEGEPIRSSVVASQAEFVRRHMKLENWVQLFELEAALR